MKPWEALDAVERVPDKVSGVWVFQGTRVPVAALFENLRDGATIEEFLEWFPEFNGIKLNPFSTMKSSHLRQRSENANPIRSRGARPSTPASGRP